MVKKRRRGKRQTGKQPEKLERDSRAKEEPSAPPQRTPTTETPPVKPLRTAQKTPPSEPTSLKRHPFRRQCRKMMCIELQRIETKQRQPASEIESFSADVPVALVAETLPPRRWEQANLSTDSAGCSPPGGPPVEPAGCIPAGLPGNQRVTTTAVRYIGSLFVPGRVAGESLSFLVDTGCTHNLLSRMVFDCLPAKTRQQMVYKKTMAAMANGSGLHIYKSIGLSSRLRNIPFEVKFLVCRTSNNAILGMEFLSRHDCLVACDKRLLMMGSKTIQCTDWMGRLLANKVQIINTLTLPPDREVYVSCRLNSEPSGSVGLNQGLLNRESRVAVAATLDRPRDMREVTVRCMNLGMKPCELKAGTVIGIYQPVEEDQIEMADVQPRVYYWEPVRTM